MPQFLKMEAVSPPKWKQFSLIVTYIALFFVASYLCYLENEKSFLKMLFEFIFKKWPVEISRFFNESLGILRFIVKLFNFCDFVCLVALQATKAIPTFDKKKKNKGGR